MLGRECPECAEPTHPSWAAESRGETEAQRNDRNFVEILQELRVAQTGVQILFAFLLTLAFSDRFAGATHFQRVVYVATLCDAAVAAVVLTAPVALHRLTFRRRLKGTVVKIGSTLAIVGLLLLAFALSSTVLLATSQVARGAAVWVTTGVALLALLLWVVLPFAVRRGHNHVLPPPLPTQALHDADA